MVTGFAGLLRVHWTGTLFGVLSQVQDKDWTGWEVQLLVHLINIRARDPARLQRQMDL